MKYLSTYLLISITAFVLLIFPQKAFAQSINSQASSIAPAQIIEIKDTGEINSQNKGKILQVKLKILAGQLKNKIFTIKDNTIDLPYQINYQKKDRVIVTVSDDGRGNKSVYISDYDRRSVLFVLLGMFLLAVLLIARKQGVTSLIGMLVSFYVIAQLIIPNILTGNNAFIMTILGSLLIIPSTYYLAHGLNKKTTVAMVGTFITLLLVALLSYFFSDLAKLTGYSSEESVFLQNLYGSNINVLSLLIAGILIGGLAVLNDITISQASVVASLKKSNSKLTIKELYGHAMNVGKDHVASLVNTLILVYVGAALPLVMLFYNTNTDLSLILNQEIIATELVRTFVTSIGIIAAVPITTYLAALFEK